MNTLHHRLDEISPLRIGESEVESRGVGDERLQTRIADKLHQAAESLSGKAEHGQIPQFGTQASTWLHNSDDYIERMEPKKIQEDITEQVRRNPGKSLLVAGAAGLILGAIFRRK